MYVFNICNYRCRIKISKADIRTINFNNYKTLIMWVINSAKNLEMLLFSVEKISKLKNSDFEILKF